jgi:RHS repeat-associated protein
VLLAVFVASAVAASGVIVVGVAPTAAASPPSGLNATDIEPILSEPLETDLGGAWSGDQETPGGASLDKSTKSVEVLTPANKAAPGFNEATAKLIGRDELTDRYEGPSGQKYAVVSPVAKNAKDRSSGKWEPLSTSLEAASGGRARAVRHPLAPAFAASADATKLMTATHDGYTLTASLDGASAAALREMPPGKTKAAIYQSVLPGVDLSYQLDGASISEQLILGKAPKSDPRYIWHYEAPGLEFSTAENGDIEFTAADGHVVFSIPPASMWDSSEMEEVRGAEYANVTTTTVRTQNGVDLVLEPDLKWLQAKERTYPVFVDPTINPDGSSYVIRRSDGVTRSDQAVLAGNSRSNGDTYWRTNVKYDYSALAGKQVIGGEVRFAYKNEGTTSYQPGVVDYASCLGYSCLGGVLGTFGLSSGATYTPEAGVPSFYASQVAAGNTGVYLTVRISEEPGQYTFKAMYTSLVLTYKDYPAVTGYAAPSPPHSGINQPAAPILAGTGTDPGGTGLSYSYQVWDNPSRTGVPAWQSPEWSGQMQKVPQGNLLPNTSYWWWVSVKDGYDGWYGISTQRTDGGWTFTTNTPAPAPPASSVTPVDGTTATTLTPTLRSTGANVGGKYQFRIVTGVDGTSGAVISSDWITATSSVLQWQVPSGVLLDGGAYTWRIATDNGVDKWNSDWKLKLKVDLRLGTSGPSPQDDAGPISVNLANGNVSVDFSSPTVQTLGGPIGQSFSYNSQSTAAGGLTARYFDAVPVGGGAPVNEIAGKLPILTRVDPGIDFDWGTATPGVVNSGSPGPGIAADSFLARWTGFVNLPAGTYSFAVTRDDGARVWINNTQVVNQWTAGSSSTGLEPQPGTGTVTLPGGPVPIQVDYYEATGPASLSLYSSTASPAAWKKIPATAYTRTFQTLPSGWGSSTALAGNAGDYASVAVSSGAVTLTDSSGTVHVYAVNPSGGYTPPEGEYGILALDGLGRVSFADEDGTVYLFDGSGRVSSVSSAMEAQKPANPVPSYRPGTGQIDSISDPLSSNGATPPSYSQKVVFAYVGDSYSATGITPDSGKASTDLVCPLATDAVQRLSGLLCRIVYPGHNATAAIDDTTRLTFDASSRLQRIVDPGNEVTDFGYDSTGLLTSIRDALANDWLAYTANLPSSAQLTEISYVASKATQVTLPAPDGVTQASRPAKAYSYSSDSAAFPHTTYVDIAGVTAPSASPANGHSGTVTFNEAYQQLSSRSAVGLVSASNWSKKDQLLSSTDAAGRMSTTIFDPDTDRVTDTFGPAPASCFDPTTRLPLTSCPMASRETTKYDEGMVGLNTTWFANSSLAGSPAAFSLGLPGALGGAINANWGVTAPPGLAGIGADNFSARMTGYIQFPAAAAASAPYTFQLIGDDSAQLWIDDDLVLLQNSAGASGASVGISTVAGEKKRIRIDYRELTGSASLNLLWKAPGASAYTTVPGIQLSPDYGLATSSTTYDKVPSGVTGVTAGQVTNLSSSNTYQKPWLGLPDYTTVDPAGLNLRTQFTYDDYLRRSTRTMPAHVGATGTVASNSSTTSTYWLPNEASSSDNPCVPTGTRQYGQLKKTTGPLPYVSAPNVAGAVTTEFVYDRFGRPAGVKNGAEGWSCSTFDARARETSTSYPALLSVPARIASTWYTSDGSATGNPLVQKMSDPSGTITTTIDLLGRTITYTDVWGTVSTSTYEARSSRLAETSVVTPGMPAKSTQYSYDADGRMLQIKDANMPIALISYDPASGEVLSETHPSGAGNAGNGSALSSLVRDGSSALTSMTWTFSAASPITQTVVRAQTGRIVKETTSQAATSNVSTYSYDAAARLIAASIPRHNLSYSFVASGGCGPSAAAGKNGNRTSTTDVQDLGAPLSTTYCYDNADRLLSSSVSGTRTGSNPVVDGVSSGEITHDQHGNVTTLADQTLKYDSDDQHISTSLTDGSAVRYVRDVTGRIVERTATSADGTQSTQRYTFANSEDIPWGVLDATKAFVQRAIALPSGAQVFIDTASQRTWFYPNMHGDLIHNGEVNGVLHSYDPFGQPIDPATGQIGTRSADDTVLDTTPGEADRGWVGKQGKLYEHGSTIATIEMGERQYVPALGRFLETDPVEGGADNDYAFPNDPVNEYDLDGHMAAAVLALGGFALGAAFGWFVLAVVLVAVAVVGVMLIAKAVRASNEASANRNANADKARKRAAARKKDAGEREHTSNARPSSKNQHDKGLKRKLQSKNDVKRNKPTFKKNANTRKPREKR